jgi:hypothetical protein
MIKTKKAQVAVLDLFISAVIFGILVAAIMFVWNDYNTKIEEHIEYNDLVIKTMHITDILTQYPGKPSGWEKAKTGINIFNQETVTTFGLASDESIIDEYKLGRFLNMTYNQTRDILNINNYNYYLKLMKTNGSDFDPPIGKGIQTNNTIVSIRRLVLYKNEEAILHFQLEE